MDEPPRIVCDPAILCGKPTIRGTRISVEQILDALAAGETPEQLLDAFPFLQPADIKACLAFAAAALRPIVVFPVPAA
jgi:uncharacterized protein (DUF433 family)